MKASGGYLRAFLAFLILSLVPLAAEAADMPPPLAVSSAQNCERNFATLFTRKGIQAQYLTEIDEVAKTPITDIFPDSFTRRGKTLARVTELNKRKFGALFDKYWDGRVGAKLLPKSEVAAYREWLAKKYGRPYQPIEAELISQQASSTPPVLMGSHFDEFFIDYLYDTKRVTVESVSDYAKTIDPSALRRWYGRAKKMGNKSMEFAFTAMLTAAILQFSSIPADVATSAINSLSQTVFGVTAKEWVSGKTKDITTSVGEKVNEVVRDWTLFIGGEEKYNSTLLDLRMKSKDIESLFGKDVNGVRIQDFDSMPRADASRVLKEFSEFTAKRLPDFQKLVLSEQKNFDANWIKWLQDQRQPAISTNSNYITVKVALDQLNLSVANREPPLAKPEELELMASYTQMLALYETSLAGAIADWMFYSQTLGNGQKVNNEIDSTYKMLYNNYMNSMSPGKLAMFMNTRLVEHMDRLEKYNKKAAGQVVDLVPGSGPQPGDQIIKEIDQKEEPKRFPPFGGRR